MRKLVQPAISHKGWTGRQSVVAIVSGARAVHALVPGREFHGQLRQEDRLFAAPPPARAQVETGAVVRQNKVRVRLGVALEKCGMGFQPEDSSQRDQLPRVEQMIDAGRSAAAMPGERFSPEIT